MLGRDFAPPQLLGPHGCSLGVQRPHRNWEHPSQLPDFVDKWAHGEPQDNEEREMLVSKLKPGSAGRQPHLLHAVL